MARGRPKKQGLWAERDRIGLKVWEAIKSQGTNLMAVGTDNRGGKGRLLRGQHSVKVAVAAVAKELKCSQTTVWNAWARFDPVSYEFRLEKVRCDYEWDIHNECRHDEALKSLQREFGNRPDFSHEEIEERAQELDEYHPGYPDD
jgi:hypothetical protein